MTTLEEIQNKLSEIDTLRSKAKAEILANDSMTKYEKLCLLNENDFLGVDPYIAHIFPDWEKECKALERQATIDAGKDPSTAYVCEIVDDVLSDNCDRHETLNLIDLMDDWMYGDADLTKTMRVVTNRGDYWKQSKIEKPIQEVVDRICDYCIANNVYGFVMDW
jgi:hypothetical protein